MESNQQSDGGEEEKLNWRRLSLGALVVSLVLSASTILLGGISRVHLTNDQLAVNSLQSVESFNHAAAVSSLNGDFDPDHCVRRDLPAISGYDVVAYFDSVPGDLAVPGKVKYSANFDGNTFFFVNEENIKRFENNPTAYLPEVCMGHFFNGKEKC